MSDDAGKSQGDLIKRYVRAKWRGQAGTSEVDRLGQMLDPAVRARVDAIGMDDEELLQVPDQAVLARLEQLERDAEQELVRALNGVRVIRRTKVDERADVPGPFRRDGRMRRG